MVASKHLLTASYLRISIKAPTATRRTFDFSPDLNYLRYCPYLSLSLNFTMICNSKSIH